MENAVCPPVLERLPRSILLIEWLAIGDLFGSEASGESDCKFYLPYIIFVTGDGDLMPTSSGPGW